MYHVACWDTSWLCANEKRIDGNIEAVITLQALQGVESEQDRKLSSQVRSCNTVCTSTEQKTMRDPGIEPGSVPWQGTILPLNQPRF